MKKIYQTIVDKEHGNCMQATIASLFELPLEEVPNFIELKQEWFKVAWQFHKDRGYDITPFSPWRGNKKRTLRFIKKILKYDGGINGYFYASVPSQTFKDTGHAVVVDTNLKVVHDPNPNQLALKLKPKDITQVFCVKNDWCINTKGNLEIES